MVETRIPNRRCLIVLLSALVWLTSGAGAWGQSDHTAKLIESAKKEGRLAWYTSMSIADSRPLLDAFEKKYPFVKGEIVRASGERIRSRILTETQAGRWQIDVVSTSGVWIDTLTRYKLISPYVSPEAEAYREEFKDAGGHWTGLYANYYVVGYNTNLVPEREAPTNWEDLLDTKWKGKIAIDRDEQFWYATLVSAWGQEKTQKYMRDLSKQNIQWRSGHTLMAQLMAAGEFPLAIVYAHRIEEMKERGAPIEWVHTLDPIVVNPLGIGLSAKPSNPNTARLFIDFILSKEGQEMIRSFNRIPARSDIEPLSPRMDQTKIKLKMVPRDMETRGDEYTREFRTIFDLEN